MPIHFRRAVPAVAAAALLLPLGLRAADTTLTGTVGDTMCGPKHSMGSMKDDECTRECVKMGDNYALIVASKVYKLDTTDKTLLATLDKNAGKKVSVTGEVKGDTITVHAVKAAPAAK